MRNSDYTPTQLTWRGLVLQPSKCIELTAVNKVTSACCSSSHESRNSKFSQFKYGKRRNQGDMTLLFTSTTAVRWTFLSLIKHNFPHVILGNLYKESFCQTAFLGWSFCASLKAFPKARSFADLGSSTCSAWFNTTLSDNIPCPLCTGTRSSTHSLGQTIILVQWHHSDGKHRLTQGCGSNLHSKSDGPETWTFHLTVTRSLSL